MLRRRLLRFFSVLSVLLRIVLLILWIDSYRTARWLYYTHYTYTYLNGRPWTDTTNDGMLLRRGAVQTDKWLKGDVHDFSGDPVVTKFGVPVDVGWTSGRWGEWDWGRVDLTTEWGDLLLVGRIGLPEPQRNWGPFGWGTTVYAVRGRYSGGRTTAGGASHDGILSHLVATRHHAAPFGFDGAATRPDRLPATPSPPSWALHGLRLRFAGEYRRVSRVRGGHPGATKDRANLDRTGKPATTD